MCTPTNNFCVALNRRIITRCLGSLKLAAAGGQVSRIQFVFYQPLKDKSFRETEVTEEAGCTLLLPNFGEMW